MKKYIFLTEEEYARFEYSLQEHDNYKNSKDSVEVSLNAKLEMQRLIKQNFSKTAEEIQSILESEK